MDNTRLADILDEAFLDEVRARDIYRKIIENFGPVRPFINIVEAEQRHMELLSPLYEKYGISLPAEPDASRLAAPETLQQACQMGVTGELENIAMYDRLIAATDLPDVIDVLQRLQAASRDHHLPAFQRCSGRGGQGFGQGQGGGKGRGFGKGQGRGRGRGFGRGGAFRDGSDHPNPAIIRPGSHLQHFLSQSRDYLFNHNLGVFA